MKTTVQEIEAVLKDGGVPVWGMVAANVLEREPAGYRPSDLLSGAKRLLCLGLPVPRGIFKAVSGSLSSYWRSANLYYRQIDMILMRISRVIEDHGGVALPIFG